MTDEDINCVATVAGILHCLQMLAEEAASLNMARTLLALRDALETCQEENSAAMSARMASAGGMLLH